MQWTCPVTITLQPQVDAVDEVSAERQMQEVLLELRRLLRPFAPRHITADLDELNESS